MQARKTGARPRAAAALRVGPFQVDELGQEDLFDEEQTTENRGARRQSERVLHGPAVCRRRRFRAMTLALPAVTRRSARAAGHDDGISDVAAAAIEFRKEVTKLSNSAAINHIFSH
jgi:hypothetical protein